MQIKVIQEDDTVEFVTGRLYIEDGEVMMYVGDTTAFVHAAPCNDGDLVFISLNHGVGYSFNRVDTENFREVKEITIK